MEYYEGTGVVKEIYIGKDSIHGNPQLEKNPKKVFVVVLNSDHELKKGDVVFIDKVSKHKTRRNL